MWLKFFRKYVIFYGKGQKCRKFHFIDSLSMDTLLKEGIFKDVWNRFGFEKN